MDGDTTKAVYCKQGNDRLHYKINWPISFCSSIKPKKPPEPKMDLIYFIIKRLPVLLMSMFKHDCLQEITYRFEKVLGEFDRIQCCRSDDEFEIVTLLNCLLEKTEKYVRMDSALVGLIQHKDRVLAQVGINEALSQKHTFRHIFNFRFWCCTVLKTNGVTDFLAQTTSKLLGHL